MTPMIFRNLLILFAVFMSSCSAQTLLNNPESVAYDAKRDRFLVSNKTDGKIIFIDRWKNMSVLNASQPSVRGLQIWMGRLYAAGALGVSVIDLETGKTKRILRIEGAVFLNDITVSGKGNLYVSDTGSGKIFRIDLSDYSVSVLCSGLLKPNGLLYDAVYDRLLVCYLRTASPIEAVDCSTGRVTCIRETGLSDLDGLTRDSEGRIYVSSWASGSIYRFDQNFTQNPELVSSGHNGPADIFIRPIADILVVPNYNSNTVNFISLKP
jgi:sugar lactone lactonase YvrE